MRALKKTKKSATDNNQAPFPYHAEKHLRKFCTVTSHELGNVLGALVGELDFGLSSTTPEVRSQAMEVALGAAERALTLARNLRYFAIHTRLDVHTVDLSQLVLDSLDIVEKEFEKKGIELAVFVDAATFTTADAGAIQQVVLNLLSNAGFAMASGGKLTLTLRQQPRTLELVVADTGVGIPATELEHIFEPYFFAEGRTPKEGLGLGLAVTKALVEAHGGEISVESTVGEGTAFTIALPFDPSIPRPMPFAEKRRYRRVNASFPVEIAFAGSKETFRTELITLSVGGCFVLLPDGASRMPEANVNLSLRIFYYGKEVIEIPQARVANLCRIGLKSGMGVEFIDAGPKAKKVLTALVKSHTS